jgi:excisionase family DNA binding protein
VGNLNDYVKFQMGEGMEKGGSAGGMATEMAIGMAIAQQMVQQSGGMMGGGLAAGAGAAGASASATGAAGGADLLSPADVAQLLGVPEADVIAIIDSGDLPAKRIGSSVRIKRSAVQAYLAD